MFLHAQGFTFGTGAQSLVHWMSVNWYKCNSVQTRNWATNKSHSSSLLSLQKLVDLHSMGLYPPLRSMVDMAVISLTGTIKNKKKNYWFRYQRGKRTMTAFKPLVSSLMPVLIIFARYAHREAWIFLDIRIPPYKIKLVSQFLTRIGTISVASHLRQHHTRAAWVTYCFDSTTNST